MVVPRVRSKWGPLQVLRIADDAEAVVLDPCYDGTAVEAAARRSPVRSSGMAASAYRWIGWLITSFTVGGTPPMPSPP